MCFFLCIGIYHQIVFAFLGGSSVEGRASQRINSLPFLVTDDIISTQTSLVL
jgi:hypothetical protein